MIDKEFEIDSISGDTVYGTGWSWFPGYAVNVSNGRRLNLMFSENSSLIDTLSNHAIENPDYTRNMIYDPSPYLGDFGNETYGLFNGFTVTNVITMNGGHAVYILDTDYAGPNEENNPHYANYNSWTVSRKRRVIPHIMYVGNWYKNANQEWLSEDIVIRARVQENYGYRETGFVQGSARANYLNFPIEIDPITGDTTVFSDTLLNHGYPYYKFNTSDILTRLDDMATKREGLKEVNIVPNPYYGMSGYETGQVDNRVKITNLPRKATIKIFTVAGTLVRTLKKDDSMTSIDWDLKNDFGIPIASGLYMIHVRASFLDSDSNEYVEKDKVIKWFGSLRPIDLDTF